MRVANIQSYLIEQEKIPPLHSLAYDEWLQFTDTLKFLIHSVTGNVPVYISTKRLSFYLYSVFVPKRKLKGDYIGDLLKWNFHVSSGWGYGTSYKRETREPKKCIFPPIDRTSSTVLNDGEPIFFLRSLYHDGDSYLEINQRFAQLIDVHKVERRHAYCKVNEAGDLEDIVTFSQDNGILCTVDRNALDFYLFLTDTVLVRVFDIQRFDKDSLNGGHEKRDTSLYTDERNEIYARRTTQSQEGKGKQLGYVRGVQIIRNTRADNEMLNILRGEDEEKKDYVSYIAFDWKHQKVYECSCDPEQLGNYFVASDLPYSTSPAFFRPEVIAKYKQDVDKYRIEHGTIYCRGAWSLIFDTNDAGQIHAYLIDLSHLPYSEQLYWKSFNEEPKSGLSEHVVKRDFEASWDFPHDPLIGLKQILREFPYASISGIDSVIWEHPTDRQLGKLTYVMTDSIKEWEDQVLELAKVLIDSFRKAELRKIARYLNCDDSQLGSIKLLKKCLEAKSIDSSTTMVIFQPLERLWGLRSSISAHAGGSAPDENLQLHYRKLVEECEQSMQQLAEIIRASNLNVP